MLQPGNMLYIISIRGDNREVIQSAKRQSNNMSELVDVLKKTKKEENEKKNRIDSGIIKLLLVIGAVLLAFFIVFGTVFSSVYFQRLYWDYVGELSSSTVYAFEHEGVTATVGEDSYVITGNQVYVFYKKLSNAEFGKSQKGFSEDAESISVDFGNGSSLRMWEAPRGERAKDILYVHYTNTEGRVYKCNAEGITLDDWKLFIQQNGQ